jgi:xylan 1,4-beta-xylosidase
MEWRDDGWVYVAGGGNSPKVDVEAPALKPHPWPDLSSRLPFTSPHFATPRGPSSTIVASEKTLTLYGSESLESCFPKSLLARRLTHHNLTATTKVSFSPSSFQQMAGITAYYNNRLFHHLYLSHDETIGNCLHIHTCDDGVSKFPLGTSPVPVDCKQIFLRIVFKESALQFFWSTDGERFSLIGPPLDASILSDDYGKYLDFTGTFVGVTSVDMSGMKHPAEFHFLEFLT